MCFLVLVVFHILVNFWTTTVELTSKEPSLVSAGPMPGYSWGLVPDSCCYEGPLSCQPPILMRCYDYSSSISQKSNQTKTQFSMLRSQTVSFFCFSSSRLSSSPNHKLWLQSSTCACCWLFWWLHLCTVHGCVAHGTLRRAPCLSTKNVFNKVLFLDLPASPYIVRFTQIKSKSILFKLDSVRSGCPISREFSTFEHSWSNWNFNLLVFKERGKPEKPKKNLSEQRKNPTTNSNNIIERGSHWLKACALTTAPFLLPPAWDK